MGNEGYYFASQPPLDPLAQATLDPLAQFGLKPPVQVAAAAGAVRGGSGTPALDAEDAAKVAAAARIVAGRPAPYVGWDAGAGGAARAEAAALRPKPSDIVAGPSRHVPTLRENWTLPTGTASVNRGVGTGGKEWLQEQVDPSQLRVATDGSIEGPPLHQDTEGGVAHAGNLFMGAGTQADLEGKMNLQAVFDEEEKRRAARSLTEAQAEDPFGIGVAQQKANIEYLFGTGRDAAKAGAESRGAQAVEAAKGEAKYAGSDELIRRYYDDRDVITTAKTNRDGTPVTPAQREAALAKLKAIFDSQYELHKLGLTSGYPPFQFPPLETKTETPASTAPPKAPGT